MKLSVTLTGTHPMLMHNGRLANPIVIAEVLRWVM
jgi:hypothetical protein